MIYICNVILASCSEEYQLSLISLTFAIMVQHAHYICYSLLRGWRASGALRFGSPQTPNLI